MTIRSVWLLLALTAAATRPATAGEGQLVDDAAFGRGFHLLDPTPGKRVVYGRLPGIREAGEPAWDVAQWTSRFPLSASQVEPRDGRWRYGNAGKAITLGPATGGQWSDLALAVYGSGEYGARARVKGEPWVHLLVSQEFREKPVLGSIDELNFRLETRLKQCRLHQTADFSPRVHAAQLLVFLTVQNLNRQSAGYGDFLWFGVPLYDSRYPTPRAYAQPDSAHGKFIYTPAGTEYTAESLNSRRWVTINRDLAPMMRKGLETAWGRGFLVDSRDLADYRITRMSVGWEVTGIYDVEAQLRGLSIIAKPR